MAAFEERVAARFDAAFVNGSALGWIARNTSKPKRNWKIDTWVLQASTAWSQRAPRRSTRMTWVRS